MDEMARACAGRGAALVAISTNEVFDGRRADGLPYGPSGRAQSANPYGRAKLDGETGRARRTGSARVGRALVRRRGRPGHVGGPAGDRAHILAFRPARGGLPARILTAARKAADERRTLDLVADEIGCPTYSPDLAAAVASLLEVASERGRRRPRGYPPHRQPRNRHARRVGPRGIAPGRRHRRHAGRAVEHVAAPVHAAALGSARARRRSPQGRCATGGPRWPSTWPPTLSGSPSDKRCDDDRREIEGGRRPFRPPEDHRRRPRLLRRGLAGLRPGGDPGGEYRPPRAALRPGQPVQIRPRSPARPPLPPPPARLLDRDRGRALVALVDLRPALAGSAARAPIELRESGPMENVVIPCGVAHGFLALEPLALLYLVTNEYDGSDELGFAWDDPGWACPGRPFPARRTGGPSCPTATARTPR